MVLALGGAAVLGLTAAPVLAQDSVPGDASRAADVGRLTRVVDAVPLRGEEIRLRVALRARLPDEPGCDDADPDCDRGAFGWLRVDGAPADGPGDELRTRAVVSDAWTVEEIRTTVPPDALEIHFGVVLAGGGAMWADDVQLAQRRDDGTWRRLALDNADCEGVLEGGRPAAWGGIEAPYRARIDRDAPYEGNGAIRIERVDAGSAEPGPHR